LGNGGPGSNIGSRYFESNDSRQANKDGWVSRYDFASGGLGGITTRGLREQGNNYSELEENGFGVEMVLPGDGEEPDNNIMGFGFAPFNDDFLDILSSCVKFRDVTEQEFLDYCAYLFNDFGVNKRRNGQTVGNVNALISGFNNNPLRIKARIFDGWYLHEAELKQIIVYYFQEGFTSVVEERDMYVRFPMEQIEEDEPDLSDGLPIGFNFWWCCCGQPMNEVQNGWPGFQRSFGVLGNQNNVPSIWQPWYLWDTWNAGFVQVFVPNYTPEMEQFYVDALLGRGYERSSWNDYRIPNMWQESSVIPDIWQVRFCEWGCSCDVKFSCIPDDLNVFVMRETIATRWIISFAENNGYLQIAAVLEADWDIMQVYGVDWGTPFIVALELLGN
jgi:hypothetical protein